MIIRSLKDLKKKQEFEQKIFSHDNVIIGQDLTANYLRFRLEQKGESCKILPCRPLDEKDFSRFPGPRLGTLRSESAIPALKEFFPDLEMSVVSDEAQFYKDQKWRPFTGRMKSETLLPGEEHFVSSRIEYNASSILNDVNFDKACILDHGIRDIEYFPDEEDKKWRIEGIDGNLIECKKLYFVENPLLFSELLKNKESFSDRFHEACRKIKTRPFFSVTFTSNKAICDLKGTLFIPQSLTHEWGHFIGEFMPWDASSKTQNFSFFSFLDDTSVEPEETAKRIKLLERGLEKIFPDLLKAKVTESLIVSDVGPFPEIDDEVFDEVRGEFKDLHFCGICAPLPSSITDRKFVANDARALFSIAANVNL